MPSRVLLGYLGTIVRVVLSDMASMSVSRAVVALVVPRSLLLFSAEKVKAAVMRALPTRLRSSPRSRRVCALCIIFAVRYVTQSSFRCEVSMRRTTRTNNYLTMSSPFRWQRQVARQPHPLSCKQPQSMRTSSKLRCHHSLLPGCA